MPSMTPGWLKRPIDAIAAAAKAVEERLLDDEDTQLLEGFPRPIQLDSYTCGAQSLLALLLYYGRRTTIRAVARAARTTEYGTGVSDIRRVLKARGLVSKIIAAARLSDLKTAIRDGAPVLVGLDGDHWGVVYGYSRTRIFLADPSVLRAVRVAVAKDDFRERWDRWAMLVAER